MANCLNHNDNLQRYFQMGKNLITGATGNVGGELIKICSRKNVAETSGTKANLVLAVCGISQSLLDLIYKSKDL